MSALLLIRMNVVVSVEELVDELWPDRPPRSSVANVRLYASRLARLLTAEPGAECLVKKGPAYMLTVQDPDGDVADFRRHVRRGRQLAARGDVVSAVTELDRGIQLWRGPAVADVPVGPALSAWRLALAQERLGALEDQADGLLEMGECDRVTTQAREILAVEPLRERAHELLIRARYQAGDVTGALTAFHAARRVLVQELGMEPGEPLQRLQKAVLDRDPVLSPLRAAGRLADPVVPRQLPADVRAFTGRAEALRQLDAMATQGAGPASSAATISVVSGTAGVGKTALALRWAHSVADRFPDGQLYVDLGGYAPAGRAMEPVDAVRGFLDTLGVPGDRIPSGMNAQAALYRSLLAGRRVLVVLDNARDVEQVRPLLPATTPVVTVVTSRHQLGGLVAADGARSLNLGVLCEGEARDMLTSRLGDERVRAEPGAVDEIITACARLPLALSIAAALADQARFPLAALAAALAAAGRRLDTLDTGDAGGQIRSVFSWSYDAISTPAQRLFRLLGSSPGPDISVAAAARLAGLRAGEARALLGELARANLLTEWSPGRYRCHDLLRAYAADLTATDDRGRTRRCADRKAYRIYADRRNATATVRGNDRRASW